uniref:Uncharacterized protein n=1 Tax=Myoviridae sp. ctgXa1 TaxID=2827700 RepID=A0A8S5T6W2_9CAUD|nr:MAG TPA: hypothetical protein [Myoviridae sp. ctgXa1]
MKHLPLLNARTAAQAASAARWLIWNLNMQSAYSKLRTRKWR